MIADYTTLKTTEQGGLVEKVVSLRVMTPVFGGGVHVSSSEEDRHRKSYDELTRFRGASIRGHLRTWWRLVHGRREQDTGRMWQREARIWGSSSICGAVTIDVRQENFQVEEVHIYKVDPHRGRPGWQIRSLPNKDDLAYGTFPLLPGSKAQKGVAPVPGVLHAFKGEATLTLRFPRILASTSSLIPIADVEREVIDSLDAWLTFGGLGGRTRRGFGAVSDTQVRDPVLGLAALGLASSKLALSPAEHASPLDALSFGLGKLRRFRQGLNIGRNLGSHRPAGRSRWPEPESIRKLTGTGDPRHAQRFVNVDKFPRAAFGLPIIFHFAHENVTECRLEPPKHDRMASPLIIRPYLHKDGKYGCLALLLPYGHVPDQLQLTEMNAQGRKHTVRRELNIDEASRGRSPLRGNPDPLLAFLDFFKLPTNKEQIQ